MTNTLRVSPAEVPGQQVHGESRFPWVLAPDQPRVTLAETVAWVERHGAELLQQTTDHGAVLLRGFPTATAEDFDAVVSALGLENFPYEKSLSNAVRVNRTERVFSANEAPPEVRIFFHHEMAQTPLFPNYIFFFCEVAPEVGGATPLCRSDVLYQRLTERCPDFIRDCEEKGLQYTNVMPSENDPESGMGRSWKSTLGVDSPQAAERRLAELGYAYRWQEDGCLRATTPPLPAVMEVSPGRKTFFNQLIAAFSGWKDSRNDPSSSIRHGDGSPLDTNAVHLAGEIAEQLAFDHAWQVGNVVLVDNKIAMHARRPFQGTRKVLASLAEMRTHRFEPIARSVGT